MKAVTMLCFKMYPFKLIRIGSFTSWNENRMKRDAFEAAENEKHRREIKRLEKAAGKTAVWSDKVEKTKNGQKVSGVKPDKGHIGAQAAKMMQRSKNLKQRRQAEIEQKSALLKNKETTFELKLQPLDYHKNRILMMDNVQIYYGDNPGSPQVSFSVEQGDRIALCGRNGSGKSSILKLILGLNLSHTGQVQRGSQLKISYVPQDTDGLAGKLKDYARSEGIEESRFLAILNKLDFHGAQFEKLLCGSNLTMIFVEHDRAFTEKIATKQVLL